MDNLKEERSKVDKKIYRLQEREINVEQRRIKLLKDLERLGLEEKP